LKSNICTERDEILKDDFPLDGSAYDDLDEEEDWAGDDTEWNEENEPEEELDAKDESTAYLEFLNEEVSNSYPLLNSY
jgi:type I site-specific restriction endonuclease